MILDLSKKNIWKDLLKTLPLSNQDIYYSPEYYSLYEEYGDGEAKCFVFKDEKNIAVYPFLINSINNLGFVLDDEYFDIQGAYGYNGIVTNSTDKDFIDLFYQKFNAYCQKQNIVAEFTRFNPVLNNFYLSKKYMDVSLDRAVVNIDLNNSFEDLYKDFSSSTKRAIKKATKNHLSIKVYTENYRKELFVELYKETMSRVNSNEYLYFNDNYFNSLFKIKSLVQFVVEHDEMPIASSICFNYGNYFHYHLGASNSDYLHVRPNDFMFRNMISYAKKSNCHFINLGGGSTRSIDDSLLRFKKGFCNKTSDFFIGKKIHNVDIYNKVINNWSDQNEEKSQVLKNLILRYRF